MESTIHCARCEQQIDAEGPSCPACGNIHTGTMDCARHPDRRAIGACVVCGDGVCEECDPTERIQFSCPDHRKVRVFQGWAQIYTTSDSVQADLIRDNLIAEGIDSSVLSQKDRSFSVDFGELSPIRVLVPAWDYVEAMRILGEHTDRSGEVAFESG